MANLRILFALLSLIMSVSSRPVSLLPVVVRPLVDGNLVPYTETISDISSKCSSSSPADCLSAVTPAFVAANRDWKDFLSLCVGRQYFISYTPTDGATCASANKKLTNTKITNFATKQAVTVSQKFLTDTIQFLTNELQTA